LLSGGSDPTPGTSSEAAALSLLLRDLGVPADAMLLEGKSRNTHENAHFSAAMLRERGLDQVLLVTSALHMQRALKTFEGEGLNALPAACDHEASPTIGWLQWVPDASSLDGSARAIKEWVGRWAQ